MSTRCRYDIVSIAMSTMWTMLTRYGRPPMTGYRCWHDIDTTSSTSRCRRCKRGMTSYRCWHDIDTISSTSRCRRYRKNIVNWTYLTSQWCMFYNVRVLRLYFPFGYIAYLQAADFNTFSTQTLSERANNYSPGVCFIFVCLFFVLFLYVFLKTVILIMTFTENKMIKILYL